ncbi:MAG: hypothetical protein NTW82_14015 [Bacteroidia bacterium]|nr:hypothetical protein [Bacteroidia bacterium]
MNSIGSFTALTGKEFFELAEGPKDVNSIRTLAWCAVVEGEACEGSELKMTELEFGRQMGLKQMKDFFQIFGRLVSSSVEKKS